MPHVHEVQLRWADLDPLAHVNNVRLMEFLQEARVALMLALGALPDLAAEPVGQVVARHEVDYLVPLYLHDGPVTVTTVVERIGTSSYALLQEVATAGGAMAARARSVMVTVDSGTGASTPIPAAARAALTDLMAGAV